MPSLLGLTIDNGRTLYVFSESKEYGANMTRDTDCKRIVRLLMLGERSSFGLSRALATSNPGNRISDARFAGAPITSRWVKDHGKRFKLYRIARAAGRKWLEQNK